MNTVEIYDFLVSQSMHLVALFFVIWGLVALCHGKSAHLRYLLWAVILVKCLIPPVFTVPVAVLPAPVITGERREMRLSWPLPRLIHAPGTRCMTSLMWTGSTRERVSLSTLDQAKGSFRPSSGTRFAVTKTVSVKRSWLCAGSAMQSKSSAPKLRESNR